MHILVRRLPLLLTVAVLVVTLQAPTATYAETRSTSRPDEIVARLDSGLTVIAKRYAAAPVVSVRVFVRAGSALEGDYAGSGISHLCEHLLSKGTTTTRTHAEFSKLLDQIGAHSNAFTTRDRTVYLIDVPSVHAEAAIGLLADWITNPAFPPEDFGRELGVVQREQERNAQDPEHELTDKWMLTRHPVHPARFSIGGTKAALARLTRDDAAAYYRRMYTPANTVVSVVGDLDPQAMLAVIKREFSGFLARPAQPATAPDEPPITAPRATTCPADVAQVRYMIGFPTVDALSDDIYPLDALACVLGDNDWGRLETDLRRGRRLALTIGATSSTPPYCSGEFAVSGICLPENWPALRAAILEEIFRAKYAPISERELGIALRRDGIARMRKEQTAGKMAERFGRDQLTWNDPHFRDRYEERLSQVTPAQVQAVARKYFDLDKLVTVLLVPRGRTLPTTLPDAPADRIATTRPDRATSRPDLATTRPDRWLSQPELATTRPELVTSRPELVTSRPDRPAYARFDPSAPLRIIRRTATQPGQPIVVTPIRRIVLDNGLRVLLRRNTAVPLVEVTMEFAGGLLAERADQNGICKLMVSVAYPDAGRAVAEATVDDIEDAGGDLTNGSGSISFAFHASVPADQFQAALPVFADWVLRPALRTSSLARTRAAELATIARNDEQLDLCADLFFHAKMFGGHNYAWPIRGRAETLGKLTAADLKAFHERWVTGNNGVLAIFGDIDLDATEKLVRELFDKHALPQGPVVREWPNPPAPPTKDELFIQPTRLTEAAEVDVGFTAPAAADPDFWPMWVLYAVMDSYGTGNGWVFQALRARQLAYLTYVDYRVRPLAGVFRIVAQCQPEKVRQVIDAIDEQVSRARRGEFTPELLAGAKNKVLAVELLSLQTNDQQARRCAQDELFGRGGRDHFLKIPERINKVTLDDLARVARKYLTHSVTTVVTCKPEAVEKK